ncbi:ABC transporter type 1 transmembrane domain [Trinorchestia longiramus]|nr:ABC transporter type 1 transmembrane domain [Trinorchestia longiramus]
MDEDSPLVVKQETNAVIVQPQLLPEEGIDHESSTKTTVDMDKKYFNEEEADKLPIDPTSNSACETAINIDESEIDKLLPNSGDPNLDGQSERSILQDDEDLASNIDCSVDDALDESCMGLEGTLERGFSLQEAAPRENERSLQYSQMTEAYVHEPRLLKRYEPTLKHLIPVRKEKCDPREMPVDKTGMVSYTMFSWMTSLMWKAYKHGLKPDDVPLCSKYDMCDYNAQRLDELWSEEVRRVGAAGASLQRVAWRFIRTRVYFGLFLFIVTLLLGFAGPTVFMRYLIEWLGSEASVTTGLCWVLGLVLCETARVLTFGLVWAVNYRTGVRLRAACLGLVYKKLMRLSSLGDKGVGEMINLFANDGQRIFDFVVLGVLIIGGPVVGVGGVAYILWLLGPHALVGMLAFLLFYPLQYCISRVTGALRRRTVRVTDERVRLVNELLVCVKLIKMYAWEDSFAGGIADVRERERVLLEKSAYLQSVSLAMAPTVPVIAAIVTFCAHIAAGNNLTPAQAYPVVVVFTTAVRKGLAHLPHAHLLWEGLTALRRIQATSIMGLIGLIHFGLDCVTHCVLHLKEGEVSLGRVQAFSVWSMLRNIGFTLFILPHSVRSLVEWDSSSARIQAFSAMAFLLVQLRVATNILAVSCKAFAESGDSFSRLQVTSAPTVAFLHAVVGLEKWRECIFRAMP